MAVAGVGAAPNHAGQTAAQAATACEDSASLWPALHGGVFGAAREPGDDFGDAGGFGAELRSLLSCTPKARANFNPGSSSSGRQGTTERVDIAVGLAFERLWHERPMGGSGSAEAGNAGEDGANGEATVDLALLGAVDGYITRYFRRVAELSRESVYQTHQREILSRMREDLCVGDRPGSLVELDEMIQRVDLDDRSLQAEIAALMQIATRGQGDVVDGCPVALGPAACCCSEEVSHEKPASVAAAPALAKNADAPPAAPNGKGGSPPPRSAGDSPDLSGAPSTPDGPTTAAKLLAPTGTAAGGAAGGAGASQLSVPPCDPCVVQ